MKTQFTTKLFLILLFQFIGIYNCSYASLLEKISPRLKKYPYFSSYKLQYAGEIGLLSIGLGKQVRPWYEYTLMYGYVPSFNQAHDIHTLALKQDFTLYRSSNQQWRTYFDLAIIMALGEHYWPAFHTEGMKKWYYYESGLEGIFALGLEYRMQGDGEWKKFKSKNFSFYAEAGLLAHWLVFYYNNPNTVKLSDMATITFGVNYYFR